MYIIFLLWIDLIVGVKIMFILLFAETSLEAEVMERVKDLSLQQFVKIYISW